MSAHAKKPHPVDAASGVVLPSNLAGRPIDQILGRLERVRGRDGAYRANCPNGHRSAEGTLSVREVEGGRVLMHCFACHDTPAILSAIGLQIADLFERPTATGISGSRRAYSPLPHWRAALSIASVEALVVESAARSILEKGHLSGGDIERLSVAADRIHTAWETLR